MENSHVSRFLEKHFRHFNSQALLNAAMAYKKHIEEGGKMLLALGGAMSTAELGISLAEMIRQDKIHAISCTGANLEEDIFNLVGHRWYRQLPCYRQLSPQDEVELLNGGYNRVTDTAIPETIFRRVESLFFPMIKEAEEKGERYFPHEYFYQLIKSRRLEKFYNINPWNSWLIAACEKNLTMVVPGWEDSTLGNMFAGMCIQNKLKHDSVKSGIEYMMDLADWYQENSGGKGIGLFQIGGGIAGDFPICVVPMLRQDLKAKTMPLWSYFCQISDSTTSFGSYSGASPNEKITWEKLSVDSPRFIIESDATIVAPLIFAYVLGL